MNPRERVRTSLKHKEGDRIPVDHNNYVSGMSEIAYRNLLKYLKEEYEIKIYDYVQRLALVKEEILDMFGVDTRYILPIAPSNFIFELRRKTSNSLSSSYISMDFGLNIFIKSFTFFILLPEGRITFS